MAVQGHLDAAQLDRPLHGRRGRVRLEGRDEPVTVYTTRPDTLHGATFMVVAADSDLAEELAAGSAPEVREAFEAYRTTVQETSDMDRLASEREKTGVDLGRFAVNPVNGERLPIWAADYVLADYGTGAIMAVPAHDQRDLDFARAFDLPVRVVVDVRDADGNPLPDPAESGEATAGRRRAGELRPAGRPGQEGRHRRRRSRSCRPRARAARRRTTGCATG